MELINNGGDKVLFSYFLLLNKICSVWNELYLIKFLIKGVFIEIFK